jgi:hypothetical protein
MTHFLFERSSDSSLPLPLAVLRLVDALAARVTRPDAEDSVDEAADADEAPGAADSSARAFSSSRSLAALTRALERTGWPFAEEVDGWTDCAEAEECDEEEVLAVASGCSCCRLSI